MKGYSTKYAPTKGISEVAIDATFGDGQRYVYTHGPYRIQLIRGATFFESRDEAMGNAREQAARKLKSLDKARVKMAALAVEPKWASE